MNVVRIICAALLLTLVSAGPTTAPIADAARDEKLLAAVGNLVGEWTIDTKWAAGNWLHARGVYDWGVGKKFVTVKTFVRKDDGGEYQRYETVFGVEDGKLTAWQFVVDGHAQKLVFDVDTAGKKFSNSHEVDQPEGKKAILHQSLELVEPHKMHWVVSIEQNGKNQPVMDGFWERDPLKGIVGEK
jgi:hypothetical protein